MVVCRLLLIATGRCLQLHLEMQLLPVHVRIEPAVLEHGGRERLEEDARSLELDDLIALGRG